MNTTKKLCIALFCCAILASGCATVQSFIKSSFPYTSTVVLPASAQVGQTNSAISSASSFDEVFGNTSGNDYVRDVRAESARITAVSPADQNLGTIKSIKLYLSNKTGHEVMIASRNDISENIGSPLVLDVDKSRFIDEYIKGTNLRIRMEYILRNNLKQDVSVKASVSFSSLPVK
ncbi:hypothetical protein C7T94_01910 [Pedobacter yulinensis]|uniref:Lipoprotein n=1 Tax=Pedobacter yulinensis TaxID=2126353 RepID=A0A2T3HR15_9SPHI|nr:hypothetical protein [Pedobacter yulinensis]PST84904.1 hypothetical protein C7T94_01910 [Pedobacter yulinensis]